MPSVNVPPRTRHRIPFRLAYIALIGFMGLFAYSYLQRTQEIRTLSSQASALRTENSQTNADNNHVQRSIVWYRTQQYVEDTARSDLGYTLPGEIPVEVHPILERVQVRAAPPRPAAAPAPTWRQWWNTFTQ